MQYMSHDGIGLVVRCGANALRVACLLLLPLSPAAREATAQDRQETSSGGFRFAAVDDKSLGLWEGERPVLVYNHGVMSRAGVPAKYNRSSYVHPLYGLDGEVLTDDFPKDHYHHRGVFWAWPHVGVGGEDYSLWSPSGIRHKFERWACQEAQEARAVLGVENSWYCREKKVVDEKIRIVVHPATAEYRSLDFELTWTAIEAVTLRGAGGKSYGGFTQRFAPREDTAITVPSGLTREDLAVTRLAWADLSAQFQGAPGRSGVAIFVDRRHPDYPPTWLTRHYGALCVGWPGVEPKTLKPGESVRLSYRLWVHRGSANVAALRRAYEQWMPPEEPPQKDTDRSP